ncbi:MAG: hypothetical protein RB289_02340 [Paludibacter sp.]|jgi:hypothetical protein|nr:hypothetical protein [Paludibacter sp.]
MIHSLIHKKSVKEDTKTSSVIGNLLHLPSALFWEILRGSCVENYHLPITCGEIINIEFWPSWSGHGTDNKQRVEADVFISFELFDLIIEAKVEDEKGQYDIQWKNECKSYYNNFPDSAKSLYLIAIGGSIDMSCQIIDVDHINEFGKKIDNHIKIIKCNWMSILISISHLIEEMESIKYVDANRNSYKRILKDVVYSFNIHSMYFLKWMNELNTNNLGINIASIDFFKTNYRLTNGK